MAVKLTAMTLVSSEGKVYVESTTKKELTERLRNFLNDIVDLHKPLNQDPIIHRIEVLLGDEIEIIFHGQATKYEPDTTSGNKVEVIMSKIILDNDASANQEVVDDPEGD